MFKMSKYYTKEDYEQIAREYNTRKIDSRDIKNEFEISFSTFYNKCKKYGIVIDRESKHDKALVLEIAEKYMNNKLDKESVEKESGLSFSTFRSVCKTYNTPVKRKIIPITEMENYVLQERKTKTFREIAQEVGCTITNIYAIEKRAKKKLEKIQEYDYS